MPARRTHPKSIETGQLRTRIVELRLMGHTLEQIGKRVGRAKGNVKKQLDKALDEAAVEQLEQTIRLRALAYGRLERLLRSAMVKGARGDLKAMQEATRLIMAQARILGFDAPIKHAQTDPSGEFEAIPLGMYQLPTRPDASLQEWQAEAARVWEAQQAREADHG